MASFDRTVASLLRGMALAALPAVAYSVVKAAVALQRIAEALSK